MELDHRAYRRSPKGEAAVKTIVKFLESGKQLVEIENSDFEMLDFKDEEQKRSAYINLRNKAAGKRFQDKCLQVRIRKNHIFLGYKNAFEKE